MALRLLVAVLWTLPAMLVQAVLLLVPGRSKERFAQIYWHGMGLILGLRVTIHGRLAAHRPTLFVANHASWLDIVALGDALPGCFIAKGDIAHWPVISVIAKLGRTIFVSRQRKGVQRESDALANRLTSGDNIILFPEGTTSDGSRILPFSSTFLALADGPSRPFVQPVTLVYDGLDGLPVRKRDRPEIAWYGDMSLAPHFARLGRRWRIHASIILHEPIPPGTYKNRKALAGAIEALLSGQAAGLRQGRVPVEQPSEAKA